MLRILKKLFLTALLLVFMVAGFLVLIATLFEDEIAEQLLSTIKKEITTDLKVEDFSLSLLSNFPSGAAELKGVSLSDHRKKPLLSAQSIVFKIGLWGLLNGDYTLNSVEIANGKALIHIDKKGKANYIVWKQSESGASAEFNISLEEATLRNMEVIYDDRRNDQYYDLWAEDANFSGEFSAKQFSLSSIATIHSNQLKVNGKKYAIHKDLVYDARIDVDLEKGVQELKDVNVGFGENILTVDGIINTSQKNETFLDLVVESKKGGLVSFLSILPDEYTSGLSDFESSGNFSGKGTIKGAVSKKSFPAINFDIALEDGKISSKKLKHSLKDVSFSARYSNGKSQSNRSSVLEIDQCKGYFQKELMDLYLKMTNFDDPTISLRLNGDLPMQAIYPFLGLEQVTDASGELEVRDFSLSGKLTDMVNPSKIRKVKNSGTIEFDDASIEVHDADLVFDKGSCTIRDNSLSINNLTIEAPGTSMEINGNFNNLLPVFLADEGNSKKAELKFKADLDATELDLDELMKFLQGDINEKRFTKKGVDSIKVARNEQRERFTAFLQGTFTAQIKDFNYNKIEANNFEGTLDFENNELFISGDVDMMEGSVNLEGQAFFKKRPYLKATMVCNQIDVKKCFYQCDNFGQEFLKDSHLKGRLDANLIINAFWDQEGNFLEDKLYVLSDVAIGNGELIGFKLLYDFSDFVKIKDLKHIKFTSLQNWFEIKNERIYLPVMNIRSNAANISIKGEHLFNNKIDYKLKINAGQVLLNKFRRHDANLNPLASQKKGWFNLYYEIIGDADNFDVRRNRRSVKKNFAQSEKVKKHIKAALEKEFGELLVVEEDIDAWIETNGTSGIPEYDEEVDGDEEYIEWDEEKE